MDFGLKSRLALVSGSTAGIGYAIAAALSCEGTRAIVNGRTQAAVDKAISSIAASTGNAPLGFAGDLSEAADAQRLALVLAFGFFFLSLVAMFWPVRQPKWLQRNTADAGQTSLQHDGDQQAGETSPNPTGNTVPVG